MKHGSIKFLLFGVLIISITGCSITNPSTPGVIQSVPSPVREATGTPVPVATTPIKQNVQPPAEQYLPDLTEFPPNYDTETNQSAQNLLDNYQLPLPKENLAMRSFRNLGLQSSIKPQNGNYFRFIYWVVITPNELNAQLFYSLGQTKDYINRAFLLVAPASIQQTMGDASLLTPEKNNCSQAVVYYFRSDPYASLRESKQLPTRNPSGGYDPKSVINAPPDVYLYSICRVKNILIVFWGHAPDNYDGKNTPIPASVIGEQVVQFWDKVIQKLK